MLPNEQVLGFCFGHMQHTACQLRQDDKKNIEKENKMNWFYGGLVLVEWGSRAIGVSCERVSWPSAPNWSGRVPIETTPFFLLGIQRVQRKAGQKTTKTPNIYFLTFSFSQYTCTYRTTDTKQIDKQMVVFLVRASTNW